VYKDSLYKNIPSIDGLLVSVKWFADYSSKYSLPSKLAQAVTLVTCIQELIGSNVFNISCFTFSWGTMIQAGSSRVRVPMKSLIFFFNLRNPSSRIMVLGSSVSWLSRKCGRLDVSQSYEPVIGIALPFLSLLWILSWAYCHRWQFATKSIHTHTRNID
jgi:hypothetical protein